jgi:DNA-binding response OmpR family regulator
MSNSLPDLVANEGFAPLRVATGPEAVTAVISRRPVAILLDWAIPGACAADVCRELRRQDEAVTIFFISSRGDEASIIRAFDAGADDYIIKPFRQVELMVRLDSHVRRVQFLKQKPGAPIAARSDQMTFGEVRADLEARTVHVGGELVGLSALEFRLLEFMAKNPGRAFSREQLLAGVYGYTADISTDRIDVLVRRVRRRLGEGELRGNQVVTVPGYGYRLERRNCELA